MLKKLAVASTVAAVVAAAVAVVAPRVADASTAGENVQRVTSEKIGDANCNNLTDIPSAGGRQHYVKWNIPAAGYCLDASGTIKPPNGSTTVHFRHLQKWTPPHPCSNPYYSGQTCITQFEQWWDDNQHPYALQLSRTVEIARDLGMAFTNRTTVPVQWNADARYYWHY